MDILKTLSYAGTMEVLLSICSGKSKFTDIMFETELNPGILNRLLKTLMSADILTKGYDGYHLSEKGSKVVLYTLKILNTDSENEKYNVLIKILSDQIGIKAEV